jgi:hypothetical protein
LVSIAGLEGTPAAELSRYPAKDQPDVIDQFSITMLNAGLSDFSQQIGQPVHCDLSGLGLIDEFYNDQAIAGMIAESDPADFANTYFVSCIELGSIMANILMDLDQSFEWLAERPYWETSLWHPGGAAVIPPFHWAIRKMSGYDPEENLALKLKMTVAFINSDLHAE